MSPIPVYLGGLVAVLIIGFWLLNPARRNHKMVHGARITAVHFHRELEGQIHKWHHAIRIEFQGSDGNIYNCPVDPSVRILPEKIRVGDLFYAFELQKQTSDTYPWKIVGHIKTSEL